MDYWQATTLCHLRNPVQNAEAFTSSSLLPVDPIPLTHPQLSLAASPQVIPAGYTIMSAMFNE
jgi:hypothetical protein